jgi:hypothetical protein
MSKSLILSSSDFLSSEFDRCCREYKTLRLAVAWCGSPSKILPYKTLEDFDGTITATVGIAFCHTHPDAIKWFLDIGADIRLFKEDIGLFHPKIYLFRDQKRYAVFVGSSNLTYGGFYANQEANILIEGVTSPEAADGMNSLEDTLVKWHTPAFSFNPTAPWLTSYRKRYEAAMQNQRKHGIHTPAGAEEEISTASWLQHANWEVYYKKVLEGLKQHERDGQGYHDVLDSAAQALPIPWTTQYFENIEKRRIIGGIKQYGWLGHVAASGQFRRLLANGTTKQWATIVEAINTIAAFNRPIPWAKLTEQLDRLISLGPTMKVWGRLLCLVRPDLYCTVAAVSVRKNLSKTLEVPQNRFDDPEGYLQLVKLIHSSPWFNSTRPTDKKVAEIWKRRAAFLDAIFY